MWFVIPNLLELRRQLDVRFPNRDHGADGTIGDTAHQAGASSHNPDQTGSPEYNDHDGKDEVRAEDIDKDLRDSNITMEQLVQYWISNLRAGKLWWVRYLIYNRRIWHRRDNFATRTYTGSNTHTDHCHVNSDFTNAADTVTGTDWLLSFIGGDTAVDVGQHIPDQLLVDGKLGPNTITKWQSIMRTPVDGAISNPSDLVMAVQRRLNATVGMGLQVDGRGIAQDGEKTHTVEALQRYLHTPIDGRISSPVSEVVRAVQRRLNTGTF